MKTTKFLRVSLLANLLFTSLFITLGIIYRDKVFQKFVSLKGNPKIVMYGNSITAQGKWVELLGRTDVQNSALAGYCTYYFLQFIDAQVINLHPEICFVMGGINDITVGVAPEKLKTNYRLILEAMVRNDITPVITLTLYEQNDPVSKAQVDTLNNFLVSYCKRNGIQFLDLNQFISDSTGLKAEYAVDKTHLNDKAYKIWAEQIRKVLKQCGI